MMLDQIWDTDAPASFFGKNRRRAYILRKEFIPDDSFSTGSPFAQPVDVGVDLGCRKGRVVCLAARCPGKEVMGIEDTAILFAAARQNALLLKGRKAPIRILELPVQEIDFRYRTAFYMFNRFGPRTTAELLKKMRGGLDAVPRKISIAYSTPDHDGLFQESGWLHRRDRWTVHLHDHIDDTISYGASGD
jgi:hypothetical protein